MNNCALASMFSKSVLELFGFRVNIAGSLGAIGTENTQKQ